MLQIQKFIFVTVRTGKNIITKRIAVDYPIVNTKSSKLHSKKRRKEEKRFAAGKINYILFYLLFCDTQVFGKTKSRVKEKSESESGKVLFLYIDNSLFRRYIHHILSSKKPE